jgi:hypothetical protein
MSCTAFSALQPPILPTRIHEHPLILCLATLALSPDRFRHWPFTGPGINRDVGATTIVLGIAGAVVLGAASYFLEPYRRILLGLSGGVLFCLSVAAAFGLGSWFGGFFGRMLALVCGVVGGMLVPRFFDLFVIGASAVSGAAW